MKIAHIHFWYSSGLGYTENMLPKSLAALGHEVHIITTNTQVYWYEPMYKEIYEPRLGPGITASETFIENDVKIHRLPHYLFCPFKKRIHQFEEYGVRGLYQLLESIQPDVIQTQGINLMSTWYAAKYAKRNGIPLFTENHIHKSVFNPKHKRLKSIYNLVNPFLRTINSQASFCFPIASDAADLAMKYYKVPRKKIIHQSLGVDTTVFYHKDRSVRQGKELDIREKYKLKDSDILIIYTGRFTEEKNPLCLAKALDHLHQSGKSNYVALFIGKGAEDYTNSIAALKGCYIEDFKPVQELSNYYWAADIGVWPAQESMSQIDAMATGLPLVLSDEIKVLERIEGNGFLFRNNDFRDLSSSIEKLKDKELRLSMGRLGYEKAHHSFSWGGIARIRAEFYSGKRKKL